MTALDDEMVPLALSLIAEFGKVVTFTKITIGPYDPETGGASETGPLVDTDLTITPPQQFEERYIDGDLVQRSDVFTFLAASGLVAVPDTKYSVEIDGISFRVMSVEDIYSGTSIALHKIHLRR